MIFNEDIDFPSLFNEAIKRSKASGKRVLIEFGGDWCIWSHRMSRVLGGRKFQSFIDSNFIFLRCPVSASGECPYPVPEDIDYMTSIPYFMLVDGDGKVLASQDTPGFEFWWFYKKNSLYSFFERWARL